MMAGTSTGSIISGALAYPVKKYEDSVPFKDRVPKFFMKEVMEVYTTKGD